MTTSEMKWIFLLVALAATGYLLVLAWNDDYIKGRVPPGGSDRTWRYPPRQRVRHQTHSQKLRGR